MLFGVTKSDSKAHTGAKISLYLILTSVFLIVNKIRRENGLKNVQNKQPFFYTPLIIFY